MDTEGEPTVSLISRIVARQWRLPAAIARNIKIEEVRIPMRDGAALLAKRYYPAAGARSPPFWCGAVMELADPLA